MNDPVFVFLAVVGGSLVGDGLASIVKTFLISRAVRKTNTVRKMATKIPAKVTVPDA